MDLAEIQKMMKSISIDEEDGEDDMELASELEGILAEGATSKRLAKPKRPQKSLADIEKFTQELNFSEEEPDGDDENLESDLGLVSELENFLGSKVEEKNQTSSESSPLSKPSKNVDPTVPLVPTKESTSTVEGIFLNTYSVNFMCNYAKILLLCRKRFNYSYS